MKICVYGCPGRGGESEPHVFYLGVRRLPVVAILDSTHAGETMEGVPIVGSVNDALCFGPTTAIVGVATQGGDSHSPGGSS